MRAKEYLMQYKKAKLEVERLDRQLHEINDLLGNITIDPTTEKVQTSPEPDQIGKLVARRADLIADITKARNESLDVMEDVRSVIEKVDNTEYRRLLQAKYIECRSWRKVIELLHWSERSIFRKHKSALQVVDRILE